MQIYGNAKESFLTAQQRALSPRTAGYAVLSLLISGGMAAYGYLTAHQSQLVDSVTGILDGTPAQPMQAQPAQGEQGS